MTWVFPLSPGWLPGHGGRHTPGILPQPGTVGARVWRIPGAGAPRGWASLREGLQVSACGLGRISTAKGTKESGDQAAATPPCEGGVRGLLSPKARASQTGAKGRVGRGGHSVLGQKPDCSRPWGAGSGIPHQGGRAGCSSRLGLRGRPAWPEEPLEDGLRTSGLHPGPDPGPSPVSGPPSSGDSRGQGREMLRRKSSAWAHGGEPHPWLRGALLPRLRGTRCGDRKSL